MRRPGEFELIHGEGIQERDNVLELPPVLKRNRYPKCKGREPNSIGRWTPHVGPFEIDLTRSTVLCEGCGEAVNPVHILSAMADQNSHWRQEIKALEKKLETIKERLRTKCEHCGKMTNLRVR